jgi:hypothetical protein
MTTDGGRLHLSQRARRGVLVAHVVSAGAWIGIDVVLGVLVFTAMLTSSTDTEALAYRALGLFAVWPLIVSGLASLATGVVLGLGTKFGLVRWWWVAVKLAMNVVLVTLVVVALRPGIADAVRHGESLAAGTPTGLDASSMFMPPIVSLTALTFATVLSVFKPWGRIRPARRLVTSTAGPRSSGDRAVVS